MNVGIRREVFIFLNTSLKNELFPRWMKFERQKGKPTFICAGAFNSACAVSKFVRNCSSSIWMAIPRFLCTSCRTITWNTRSWPFTNMLALNKAIKKKNSCVSHTCVQKYVDSFLPHLPMYQAQFLTFCLVLFFFFFLSGIYLPSKKVGRRTQLKRISTFRMACETNLFFFFFGLKQLYLCFEVTCSPNIYHLHFVTQMLIIITFLPFLIGYIFCKQFSLKLLHILNKTFQGAKKNAG